MPRALSPKTAVILSEEGVKGSPGQIAVANGLAGMGDLGLMIFRSKGKKADDFLGISWVRRQGGGI